METREDILKELKEIAPNLASLNKVNAYQIPEGYFVSFTTMMTELMKPVDARQELQSAAPSLSKLQKPVLDEIPANYFSAFRGQILSSVRAEDVSLELAHIAPYLSVIEKSPSSKVPAAYFNAFAGRVLKDIKAAERPAIVNRSWTNELNSVLDKVINTIFMPGYSVAFVGFATMLILGVLIFVKVEQSDNLDYRFAQLSNDEINNYLDNKSDAYSDEVFEMNLETKGLNTNAAINNVHAYKDALKDINDDDLNAAIAD